MRTCTTLLAGTALLLLGGCSPKSEYRNFASPENAVRTLLEACKVQDKDTAVDAVVARERVTFETSNDPVFTFTVNGKPSHDFDYTILAPEFGPERRAQVPVTFGGLMTFSFPCELEAEGWRISMLGMRNQMLEGFGDTLEKLEQALEDEGLPAPR